MLASLITRLLAPRKVAGVELHTTDDGSVMCHYVVLKRTGSRVDIIDQGSGSWDQLPDRLPKQIPLGVVLTGKGILVKKGPASAAEPAQQLQQLLPNIQLSEFVYQTVPVTDSQLFALLRAETLNKWITQCQAQGRAVLVADLAFLGAAHLLTLFPDTHNPLRFSQVTISHSDGRISGFEPAKYNPDPAADFGGLTVNADQVAAFASGLALLAGLENQSLQAPALQQSRQHFRYQTIFEWSAWGLLGGLLLALLINTLAFFHYSEQVEKQGLLLAAHQRQLDHLDSLQAQYRENREFFESNKLNTASITAWYSDQLAMTLPPGIQLRELHVFPLKTGPKNPANTNPFQTGVIRISGHSQQSTALNFWLNTLKQLPWVADVKVMPYSEDAAGRGAFELEVNIK